MSGESKPIPRCQPQQYFEHTNVFSKISNSLFASARRTHTHSLLSTSALPPRTSTMLSLRGLRGLTLASLACGASSFTMSHFAAGAALRRTSPTAVTSRRLLSRGGATRATPCMASSEHFDYLVIGGGSGGVSSARRAATYDAKVCCQLNVIYNTLFLKHEHMSTRDQDAPKDTWPPLFARLSVVAFMCTAGCIY